MTTIGKTVLELTADKFKTHLFDYAPEINGAYLNLDEGALTVNMSAKFSEDKNCLKVETSISFTAEKIKDRGTILYDPNDDQKPKQTSFDELTDKFREILFRDFSDIRNRLKKYDLRFWMNHRAVFGGGELTFKKFDLAA